MAGTFMIAPFSHPKTAQTIVADWWCNTYKLMFSNEKYGRSSTIIICGIANE
jgi:hypothetical protein